MCMHKMDWAAMPEIHIYDPTLRDGNHAVQHQLNEAQIKSYCVAAEAAGIPTVEAVSYTHLTLPTICSV